MREREREQEEKGTTNSAPHKITNYCKLVAVFETECLISLGFFLLLYLQNDDNNLANISVFCFFRIQIVQHSASKANKMLPGR